MKGRERDRHLRRSPGDTPLIISEEPYENISQGGLDLYFSATSVAASLAYAGETINDKPMDSSMMSMDTNKDGMLHSSEIGSMGGISSIERDPMKGSMTEPLKR